MRKRQQPFDLGPWRVDPEQGLLKSREMRKEVRLEPRQMDLLLLFAGSDGQVLTKDAIVASVWGGRAVGDDTLASAISRLRSALGETETERYIETLPKRGYRLLCDVGTSEKTKPGREKPTRVALLMRQGEAALHTPIPAGLAQARDAFERAIAEEPSLAAAHLGLAETLVAQHFAGEDASVLATARAATLAALGLDKTDARAWSLLGTCTLLIDREFDPADESFRRAIALDAEIASAHLARAFAFACTGRFVDAEREARKSIALQPIAIRGRGMLLQVLIAARRFRPAIAAANELLSMAPSSAEAWYAIAWSQHFLGDAGAAVDAALRGFALWGVPDDRLAEMKRAFSQSFGAGCAKAAELFESQNLLFRPRATDVALLKTAAGDFDAALAALARAARRDDPYLLLLPWLPHFDPLREDTRFAAFLSKLRLVR